MEELTSNPERRKYLRENFVKKPTYAMLYMQLEARVKHEQQAGRIDKIDTFDLMFSIASMTVFTFISLPMYQDLLSKSDDQLRDFINHRKAEVTRMILKSIRP